MNEYMKSERYMSPERLESISSAFRLAADNTFTVFGDRAFRRFTPGLGTGSKSGRWENAPNRALTDVILFWFARYERRQVIAAKDAIREELIFLMSHNDSFKDAITLGTSDPHRVRTRFQIWGDSLENIIQTSAREPRLFSLAVKQKLLDNDPTCRICSQRIESIDDSEVDHIQHYWRGGTTTPDNARLVHRYCNRARPN